jgi:hypothetical protein
MPGMILAYRTASSFSRAVSAQGDSVLNLLMVVVISACHQTVSTPAGRTNLPINKEPIFQYLANWCIVRRTSSLSTLVICNPGELDSWFGKCMAAGPTREHAMNGVV